MNAALFEPMDMPPNSLATPSSDLLTPPEMTEELLADAKKKSQLRVGKLAVLSFLCTPFLAYATALCALLVTQG